jgi:hypothetical protein
MGSPTAFPYFGGLVNYVSANKTKILGALLVAFGVLQAQSEQIRSLLTPERFAWFTIILGVGVAVLGFLNSGGSVTPPGEKANVDQGGKASLALALLFPLALMLAGLGGCTGTREAYKAATASPQRLEATAYVVSEQYYAIVAEAASLKAAGTLSGLKLEAVRRADDAVRPLVIGGPAGAPGIVQLRAAYRNVKDAKSEADLQKAVDAAVLKLADLINAVKGGR